jgi:phage-related protein
MPAIGAEVADAYIEVHASTGPFRRELRRDARLAAQEASNEFGTEFTKAVDRDLSPLGASISQALREAGEQGGFELIEEIADQVRARADRINTAFARSLTFNDFGDFVEQFSDLDDAIEDFDSRLRELNRDGTLTNETFDRLNASFNAYIKTIQDDSVAQALKRDREEAVALEKAHERLTASLGKNDEAARRFNIGLGSLRGSRNDFLNFIGTLAGFLERNIGRGLEGLFTGIGNGVSRLGQSLSETSGPLAAVGRGLDSFGGTINKLGAGGLDGLIIQAAALILGLQALVAILGPVAAGVSGLAAAFTALAVGIGGGLLGGILALGPGLAALAAGAGAVAIAFTDLSKSQKAVFDPLKELLDEVRGGIQEQLFDGLGNQVDRLTSALTPLGPFLANLAGVFSDWVSEVVGEIGPNGPLAATFDSLGRDLPGIFRTLLDLVSATGGALTGLFAGAAPGAERLFQAITGVVERFSAWTNTTAGQQAINGFLQQAVDILGELWRIAAAVGDTFRILWEGGGAAAAQELLAAISGIVERMNAWLQTAAGQQQLLAFFRNGVQVVMALGAVVGALINLFNSLDNSFTRIAFQVLIGHVVAAIDAFTQFSRWTLNLLGDLGQFAGRVQTVVAAVGNLGARAAAAGSAFRTTLGNAFTAVGNFITTLVKRFASLRSPMELAAASGRNLRSQLVSAFNTVVQAATNFGARVRTVFNAVVTTITGVVSRAGGALRSLASTAASALGAFVGAIQRGVSNAVSALAAFAGRAAGSLAGLAGRFVSLGLNIMQGLYNGVVSGAGRVISYIRGLADQVASAFASVLGIASPSKLFAQFGGNIIDGLVNGMRRREKDAQKEGDRVAQAVINGAQTSLEKARGSIANTARIVTEALASAGDNPRLNKVFKTLGTRVITALTNGLDDGREAAQGDVKSIIERIGKVAQDAMKGEDAKTRKIIANQAKALQQWVKGQGAALDAIWREVDRSGVRLEAAREKLQELQQEFTQMREQVRDSLRGELDLGGAIGDDGTATFESVASQVSGLAARMKKFAGLIKKLIKAGFPAALVQEVAALGSTEGIAVANALLSGTAAQQQDLITDFKSIQSSTDQIGKALAEQMFQAGIDAQKGLIKGLEANQAALIKAAKKIAKTITDEIKRELGIKSPSTVFRQIGEFIVEGLAQGIEGGARRVDGAVSGLVNPDVLGNVNAPISSLAAQQTSPVGAVGPGGIAAGAITIVSPFANPRLVALETLDALAARGK